MEKLIPFARKFAPGSTADVMPAAVFVVCCVHVPFPILLAFDGVNLHSSELDAVWQEPVYTDISSVDEIEGVNATVSSLVNGRYGDMLLNVRFEVEMIEVTLKDTSWCRVSESDIGRKAYAMSLFCDEI